jgi:hypothetical protein
VRSRAFACSSIATCLPTPLLLVGARSRALTWDLELAARLLPEGAVAPSPANDPDLGHARPSLVRRVGGARGLCHHPSKDWLVGAGYGPDRAGAVEVCDVAEYLLWRAEQPLCILHELAHALQHQLGDPAEIRAAFDLAVESGAYERVPFAMIPEDQTRRAYALNKSHRVLRGDLRGLLWAERLFPVHKSRPRARRSFGPRARRACVVRPVRAGRRRAPDTMSHRPSQTGTGERPRGSGHPAALSDEALLAQCKQGAGPERRARGPAPQQGRDTGGA